MKMITKPIPVNDTNREKIEAELDAIQRHCSARCITYDDIVRTLAYVDEHLQLIPKKYRRGIEIIVDPHAQSFPSAYNGRPESTHFSARRTSTGWSITGISRGYVSAPTQRVYIKLTDDAKAALLNNFAYMP